MADVVTVEYRGVSEELAPGDALVVEACVAGVLVLRRAPSIEVAPALTPTEGAADVQP